MRGNERHTMKCQRDYGRHAGLADRLDWNILTSFVFSSVQLATYRIGAKLVRVSQTIVLFSQSEKLGWAPAFSETLCQKGSPKKFLKIFEHV